MDDEKVCALCKGAEDAASNLTQQKLVVNNKCGHRLWVMGMFWAQSRITALHPLMNDISGQHGSPALYSVGFSTRKMIDFDPSTFLRERLYGGYKWSVFEVPSRHTTLQDWVRIIAYPFECTVWQYAVSFGLFLDTRKEWGVVRCIGSNIHPPREHHTSPRSQFRLAMILVAHDGIISKSILSR